MHKEASKPTTPEGWRQLVRDSDQTAPGRAAKLEQVDRGDETNHAGMPSGIKTYKEPTTHGPAGTTESKRRHLTREAGEQMIQHAAREGKAPLGTCPSLQVRSDKLLDQRDTRPERLLTDFHNELLRRSHFGSRDTAAVEPACCERVRLDVFVITSGLFIVALSELSRFFQRAY